MKTCKDISIIVFWGAVWGIAEATLGHMLHVMDFNIGWLVWFPLAFYFMSRAYKETGKTGAILYTSLIASAIKLINLLMPVRIDKVINPAISILLEGTVLFLLAMVNERNRFISKYKLFHVAAASFGWRVLYSVYAMFMPQWMKSISPIRGIAPFLKFFLYEGAVGGSLIFGIMILSEKVNQIMSQRESCYKEKILNVLKLNKLKEICFKPYTAFSLLAIALIIQWVL